MLHRRILHISILFLSSMAMASNAAAACRYSQNRTLLKDLFSSPPVADHSSRAKTPIQIALQTGDRRNLSISTHGPKRFITYDTKGVKVLRTVNTSAEIENILIDDSNKTFEVRVKTADGILHSLRPDEVQTIGQFRFDFLEGREGKKFFSPRVIKEARREYDPKLSLHSIQGYHQVVNHADEEVIEHPLVRGYRSAKQSVSNVWAVARAQAQGIDLRVVNSAGKKKFAYYPHKGRRPIRHDPKNYREVEYMGSKNKYFHAFQELKSKGFKVIDFDSPEQQSILGLFHSDNPSIHLDGLDAIYAIDRHRIEAAEAVEMPIVVDLTDIRSVQ